MLGNLCGTPENTLEQPFPEGVVEEEGFKFPGFIYYYFLTPPEKQVQITDCCVLEDDWLGVLACRQPRSLTLHSCLHASRGCDGPGPETIFPALRGCSSGISTGPLVE